MKKPSQLISVGGRLIQENEKLRVCQHEAGGIGTEQLFHILRQPRHKTIVFSDSFPHTVEEIGAVLIAEQEIELIREYPSGFTAFPVLNDPVEDRVQGDQHADGHELFTQFPDVIGDDPGFGIYVGVLSKGVEAAGDEELRRERQSSGFRLRLFQKGMVQIL